MSFEVLRRWIDLSFLPPSSWDYYLGAIYGIICLVLLVRSRQDFKQLKRLRIVLFALLLAAPFLTSHLLVLEFSGRTLLPPPGVPVKPAQPFIPLLGLLPIVAAGAWLGGGPALIVGLISGLLRASATTGGIADPFYLALLGFMLGRLLRQDYRGLLPAALRQPIIATPALTVLSFLALLLSVFAHVAHTGLSGFDYAMTLTGAYLGPAILEGLLAGLIVQTLYFSFPQLRPVRIARRTPPYNRSLKLRLLFLFVPLILVMTLILLYGVTTTTLHIAKMNAINEMARDANSAAEGVPYFIHTGQGLLREFANDERLWHTEPITMQKRLRSDMRTIAFFDQLIILDSDQDVLGMYPPPPEGDPELTVQETKLITRVLESGAPQVSTAHRSARDEDAILSFIAPIYSDKTSDETSTETSNETPDEPGGSEAEEDKLPPRAMLGRTRLDFNPMLNRIQAGLQWTNAQGEGFIVDSEGRIVAHQDSDMLLVKWHLDEDSPSITTSLQGRAYESPNPTDNTRQIVYYLPTEGFPWGIVIRLPYEVVLQQAGQVAQPLLLLQLLFGGVLVTVLPLVTSWMTRPLTQLASAADRIAEGDLTQPVRIAGEDEVARVGDAFDDMRLRLKGRLEDLSLLLEISQAVSATLSLPQGMPFILEGALEATGAQAARIVLLSGQGEPQVVMSRGAPREGLGSLDRALTAATKKRESPLAIENLNRAKGLLEINAAEQPIKAAIALPVRTKKQVPAVMWIGYGEPRQFESSEIDLLSTLASQTAVLVENARLFQAAEGERQRLSAILASTTDAVIVTDRDNDILLVNPAAEQAFNIRAENVSDKHINQAGLAPALVRIFQSPMSSGEALTDEVPLPDDRTLYANVSTILSPDGERIGRVAVMRDITHLKELDEMKSEFVSTVSHDLRAPLTFMRGYATMLPTIGELTEKQHDYVEKILKGVSQMSELVDDLLNLGRIEAGVGLERETCHLGAVLVEAVDGMRARASTKGLTLRMEPAQAMALVSGDAALLRQAVSNLVDNAIKYTPSGGMVTVGLSVKREGEQEKAIIHVSDTGIGIAPENQVRLFEKFYRIQRRDGPQVSGTGLGLSIVKSIVERHGGKVWVDSELNKGSTFYISLPLADEKQD